MARKKLAERKAKLTIPETLDWFAKPVGQKRVIPQPRTPIRVNGSKLSFLLGKFDGMEKMTLQIESESGKQPSVSQLSLSIPFAKGLADLYRPNHASFQPNKSNFMTGALPFEGVAHDWRAALYDLWDNEGAEPVCLAGLPAPKTEEKPLSCQLLLAFATG